jgi:hypothetical protein
MVSVHESPWSIQQASVSNILLCLLKEACKRLSLLYVIVIFAQCLYCGCEELQADWEDGVSSFMKQLTETAHQASIYEDDSELITRRSPVSLLCQNQQQTLQANAKGK